MDSNQQSKPQAITRGEALTRLRQIAKKYNGHDEETGHLLADQVLLELINDSGIRRSYESVSRWHA